MKSITQVVQNLIKPYIDNHDKASKQAAEAIIAPVETDATSASANYAIGAQLVLNDVLYDVTSTITAGDPLTVGTNIAVADDITTRLASADSAISTNAGNISTNTTNIGNLQTFVGKKLTAQTLSIGATTLTFSDASITTNSTIEDYESVYGVAPTNITVTTGQAVLTFEAQAVAVSVYLIVR